MQDAGRIVHRAIRIDGDWKTLFPEALTDTVGKAGTYEEHLFARPDFKLRLRNIHYRPKLHLPQIATLTTAYL
jgi:hypothetical protein